MKNAFVLIVCLITCPLFSQTVYWANSASGNKLDEGNGIAIDQSDNLFITGQYETAVLNFGTTSITNNSSLNDEDGFVAKIDVSGNCVWAKTIGGADQEYGSCITVDENGCIIVAGDFSSTSFLAGSTTLTNAGDEDVYVIKYSPSGDVLWAKSIGGNYDDNGTGLSCDNSGNIYVTGFFWSNELSFGDSSVTSHGDVDVFIAKYNSDGEFQWAKSVGGTGDDRGLGIVTDGSGNSFITGGYESSSVNFGANTLTNSEVYEDYLYLAKYDTDGNNLWAKSASSAGASTYGSSVSLDASGNCYVGGTFDGLVANFGVYSCTNSNPGGSNAFVAKYSNSGIEQWASNPVSGPEGNQTYCITADDSGNSYISGWYTSPTVTFGSFVLTSSAFGDNIFLAKYNTLGQVVNAYSFSGSGMSGGYGNAICNDNSGNVYLTGYFEGTNMIFGSTTLLNTGSYDVYWNKIGFSPAAVNEHSAIPLTFYPNPCNGIFSVSITELAQMKIYNLTGICVDEIQVFPGENIDVSELPSGLYFLHAFTETCTYSGTLLIE